MGWILTEVNAKMNSFNETVTERNKTLTLVGSQVNLTPRSDHSVFGSFYGRSCKLCSPGASSRTQTDHQPRHIRPRSAECTSVHVPRDLTLWPFEPSWKRKHGNSLTVSHLTDSSTKLLQDLIEIPSYRTSSKESGSGSTFIAESSPKAHTNNSKLKDSTAENFSQSEKSCESSFLESSNMKNEIGKALKQDGIIGDQFHLKGNKFREVHPEAGEEKTVRFTDGQHLLGPLPEKKRHDVDCNSFRVQEMLYTRSKSELELPCGKRHTCHQNRNTVGHKKVSGLKKNKSECDVAEVFRSVGEDHSVRPIERGDAGMSFGEERKLPKESDSEGPLETVEFPDGVFKLRFEDAGRVELAVESKDLEGNKSSARDEETCEEPRKHDERAQSSSGQKVNLSDSTYEEIVDLLQTLEDEDSDSINLKEKEGSAVDVAVAEVSSDEKVDYFNVVSSYLEEVEVKDMEMSDNYTKAGKWKSESFSSPRLEELLNKNPVELAHEVFSLKIQVEDQKKGIKLLKETLAEMKEEKKAMELEHQEALEKINSDAEILVQRHQKFIKQLLSEKNNLNETVSKLVKDLKSGEEKYKRNLKAIEEKHVIEIKRAKETQAVADKIKREKWMEVKTQKIKEMTVKGLEPELSRMAARQQEEMTELRNLHKAEIEAIELRAARRSSDLMDELRAELTKEKERVVAKEIASVRATMEKEFDEERNRLQKHCQNLKESIRKQEEKLSNQEQEFKDTIAGFKQEEEKKKQKMLREHEENIEEIRRQHLVELRNLRESLEAEREVFLNNYKKKQAAKFLEREAELHQQYKKERDREIEMIIETLENEAAQIQLELTRDGEAKLKRLREKMEAELKEIEGNEAALKVRLSETKAKLSEKEDFITDLNSQIRQLQTELNAFKKSCEEMSSEKAKMKELIRGEFEDSIAVWVKENENLEKELGACKEQHAKELAKKDQFNLQQKHEMQKELTRVYSRIKTAVSKKEKIIESLRQENGALSQRCQQLEVMLDQQRRNLLLQ